MAYEIATAYVSLIPSLQGAQGQIAKQLIPDATAAGDQAGASSGGRFNDSFMKWAAPAAIVAGVAGTFKGLYEVGSVFDDVADTIRVGTGASGEALNGLTAVAESVGRSIPAEFSAVGATVADLNTRLGLSGGTLDTVAKQYLEAGRILGTDVDINATSAAFSAFQIEGDGVVNAMDSLFQVSQATGVGMNELAGSVQSAAPALQTLGFSFKDSAALAGSLDKAGLNTGQVMNGLGKALVTLAKDGEEPQAAFQRTTQELQGFIDAGDKGAALDLASQLFGTKGANQFVAAMESGTLSMTDLFAATGAGSDTIIGLGKETMDAAESWKILKNNGIAALEPLGALVFGTVGTALGFLAGHASGFVDVLQGVGDTIGSVFGSVFSSMGSQLDGVMPILSPFGLIFQALLPVLPQIGALVGDLAKQLGPLLGGALATAAPLMQDLVSTLSGVFVSIMPTVASLIGVVGAALSALLPAIMPLVGSALPLITAALGAIMPAFASLTPVLALVGVLIGALVPVITSVVQIIVGVFLAVIQALLPVVTTVFTVIADVITAAMQVIQGVIQVVTGIISGDWSMVWDGIKNILSGVWNTITTVVSGAVAILGSVIAAGLSLIGTLWNNAWSGISGFLGGIWGGITGAVSGGIGAVVGLVGSIKDKIIGAVSGAGQWLWDAGKNVVQGLMDGIRSLAGGIGRFFLDLLPGWIVEPFKAALGIHSPSRVFRDYGVNIGEGLMLGVGDMESDIGKQMDSLVTVPSVPSFAGDVGTVYGTGAGAGRAGNVFNINEAANPHSTAVRVARLMERAI